jgi:hypothetical protein
MSAGRYTVINIFSCLAWQLIKSINFLLQLTFMFKAAVDQNTVYRQQTAAVDQQHILAALVLQERFEKTE